MPNEIIFLYGITNETLLKSLQNTNSQFAIELKDVSGIFSVEPKSCNGTCSVAVRVANGKLDYEDHRTKFILEVQ